MEDFIFQVPTKIIFGKNDMSKLGGEIRKFGGTKVLLVYGKSSIKKMGLYDKVVDALRNGGLPFEELSGVQANPRVSKAREGVRLCKEKGCDFLLAVGGGSTIDCTKLIAAAYYVDEDPWDIVLKKVKAEKALPIGTILTLSATGSEMDKASVITNEETREKLGWASKAVLPKFSYLNPENTFTVSARQTAAGTADIMSHIMENYFSVDDSAFVQDSLSEGLLRTCLKYGKVAVKEPENYEARANLMWAGSWAINGLVEEGKTQAWSVHPIEHELSAQYDITHGVGLAIITPRWLKYVLNSQTVTKISRFGRVVFGLEAKDPYENAIRAIEYLYQYFEKELHIPMTLKELDIDDSLLEKMAKDTIFHHHGTIQGFQPLSDFDVLEILRACLEEGID